jgi:hypothetical protein
LKAVVLQWLSLPVVKIRLQLLHHLSVSFKNEEKLREILINFRLQCERQS